MFMIPALPPLTSMVPITLKRSHFLMLKPHFSRASSLSASTTLHCLTSTLTCSTCSADSYEVGGLRHQAFWNIKTTGLAGKFLITHSMRLSHMLQHKMSSLIFCGTSWRSSCGEPYPLRVLPKVVPTSSPLARRDIELRPFSAPSPTHR